jgi:hypothetical protein
VTVEDDPDVTVTVSGRLIPLAEPAATEPAVTLGVNEKFGS